MGGCYSGTVLGGQVGDRLTRANPLTLTQPEEGRQGSGEEDSLLYNKSKEKEQGIKQEQEEKEQEEEEKEVELEEEEEEEGVSKPPTPNTSTTAAGHAQAHSVMLAGSLLSPQVTQAS